MILRKDLFLIKSIYLFSNYYTGINNVDYKHIAEHHNYSSYVNTNPSNYRLSKM